MRTSMSYASLGFLLAIPLIAASSQAEDRSRYLIEKLESAAGLPGLLANATESDLSNWPTIGSDVFSTREGETDDAKNRRQLAESLLSAMRIWEQRSVDESIEQTSQHVQEVYAPLAKALLEGGGFVNFVLLDSLNRCAVSRIAHSLIWNPTEATFALDSLEALQVPGCEGAFLQRVLMESGPAKLHYQEWNTNRLKDTQRNLFESEGFADDDTLAQVELNPLLKTSSLMVQESVSPLFTRLMETWKVASMNLPGLVEYLKRGGRIDDLTAYSGDFPRFRSLMGDSLKRIRFEPEGQAYLRPSDLFAVVQMFKDSPIENRFFRVAVE